MRRRFPTLLLLIPAGSLATFAAPEARAWHTGDHYNETRDACEAQKLRKPSKMTQARWETLWAWAMENANDVSGDWSRPFNNSFCREVAYSATWPDIREFANDAAHMQSAYTGGLNDPAATAAHSSGWNGPAQHYGAHIAAVVYDPPSISVDKWIDNVAKNWRESRGWIDKIFANDRSISFAGNVHKGFWWWSEVVGREYTLGGRARFRFYDSLGAVIHQFQDSCSHQGISGAQHAWLTYAQGVPSDPDSFTPTGPNGDDGRFLACTRPLTQAFFASLAQSFADLSADVLTYVTGPLSHGSWITPTADALIGIAPHDFTDINDYFRQMCDQQCRGCQDDQPSGYCHDTRFNNDQLFALWNALLAIDVDPTWNLSRLGSAASPFASFKAHVATWPAMGAAPRPITGERVYDFWHATDSARSRHPALANKRLRIGIPTTFTIKKPNLECPKISNRAVAAPYQKFRKRDANDSHTQSNPPSIIAPNFSVTFPKIAQTLGTPPDAGAAKYCYVTNSLRDQGQAGNPDPSAITQMEWDYCGSGS